MDRKRALEILNENLKNQNLVKHCLALEAVMADLAGHFGEDQDIWGLAGLLHDLDYEETKELPELHAKVAVEKLNAMGASRDILDIIEAHNPGNGTPVVTVAQKAIVAADPLTGLIVAAALMHPDKKLKSIDTQFVLNRFKTPGFARGANREQIKSCEEIGLTLEEFVGIALGAMQRNDKELGL